jgi:membrane protein
MESANANFEIKLVALSMRIWRYAHLLVERLRGKRRSDSVRPYRQNSILSETSLLLSFGIIGGWLLFRLFPKPKRRQSSMTLSRKAERHPSQPISSVHATKHVKGGRGILSLAIELLGAVAISLAQRYAKSWSSSLMAQIKNAPDARKFPSPSVGTELGARSERQERSETAPEKPAAKKLYPKSVVALLKNTAGEWMEDKCPQLGAALAYFTVFSLAPLVVVLLAVFGLIFGGSEHARDKITEQLQYFVDPSGIKVIQDIAAQAARPKAGIMATTIGVIVGLFGASGVFGELQNALNTIWGVKPKPGGGIWGFLRARFLSFAMVGGVCFLLLVSLTVETMLRGLNEYLKAMVPGGNVVAMALFLLFDLLVIVLLFALIFRYLPDARIAWRDVWIGATLTAVLFVLGKFILALYLGSGAAGSAYGAASSLITLLLWTYYAAQILLFGAEFTQVYANTYGSLVEPKKHAVKVERTEREVTP